MYHKLKTKDGLNTLFVSQILVMIWVAILAASNLTALATGSERVLWAPYLIVTYLCCGFLPLLLIIHLVGFITFYSARSEFSEEHEKFLGYSLFLYILIIPAWILLFPFIIISNGDDTRMLFSILTGTSILLWELAKFLQLYHLQDPRGKHTDPWGYQDHAGNMSVSVLALVVVPFLYLASRALYLEAIRRTNKRITSGELEPRPFWMMPGVYYPPALPVVPAYGAGIPPYGPYQPYPYFPPPYQMPPRVPGSAPYPGTTQAPQDAYYHDYSYNEAYPYEEGYEEEHGEGYEEGHGKGYEEGHGEGYEEEHGEGYEEEHGEGYEEEHGEGYEGGHGEGYEGGHGEGYEKGHGKGYEKGHGEGYEEEHGEGYEGGHGEGYEKGHGEGYEKGHGEGYEKGHGERAPGNGSAGSGPTLHTPLKKLKDGMRESLEHEVTGDTD